jgi:hypothetical protein
MSTPSPDVVGVLLAAMIATIVLTPILSLLVLWRYRRAVRRSMHATAPGGGPPAIQAPWSDGYRYPDPRPRGPSAPIVALSAESPADTGAAWWPLARRRMRSLCYVYVAAGATYGLVAAIVWLEASGIGLLPRRLSVVAAVYAWPVVPTALAVLAAGRRTMALVWTGYVLLVLLLSLGAGAGPDQILVLILIIVGPAAVLLLALSGRNLRAVGPFLAAPVVLAAAGLVLWPWFALPLVEAGATVALAEAVVIVAVLLLALTGLAYLWWSARQYARKRASDQMVLVSQWWFVVTAVESTFLLPQGVVGALAFWLAYLAFRMVIAIGLRLRRRPVRGAPPPRLLLLRVFGAHRRSEGVLRRVGASWRHLGPVQMIAGTDLAAAALEPHEFLDSLRGRLNRQFVGDADDLLRRLAQLDLEPDPDGRYRVNELFCHDDTWRSALQALVQGSDCILLDLRGFTVARQGVTYEITQLVELVPLRRVLVLVDDTTDHNFLRTVLDTAWRGIGPASPNWGEGGALRVLQGKPRAGVNAEAVVALLSGAAYGQAPPAESDATPI